MVSKLKTVIILVVVITFAILATAYLKSVNATEPTRHVDSGIVQNDEATKQVQCVNCSEYLNSSVMPYKGNYDTIMNQRSCEAIERHIKQVKQIDPLINH